MLQEKRKHVRNERTYAARVLNDAARTAQFLTDGYEGASTLANVARMLAATDPDRATRLFDDAERTARSIADEPQGPVHSPTSRGR